MTPRALARYASLTMRLLLALTAVLALGCAKKEIGEPCRDANECEFDSCLSATSSKSSRRICTKVCDSDADCPNMGTCIGGRCDAACTSQDDCPDETVCRDGLCLVECRSDDDCVNATCPAPGQVCEQ